MTPSQVSLRSIAILAAAVGCVVVIGFGIRSYFSEAKPESQPVTTTPTTPTAPSDPRLTYDTPFRNVRPDVKYVGDAACAACHPKIDHAYHQHPMGRSAALVGPSGTIEKFDAAANNPASSQGFQLRVERTATGFRHVMALSSSDKVPSYSTTPVVAIGSGARGRSYLAVESGAVWQSPMSWYSQTGGKWDVSPGYQLPEGTRRAIETKCLFCHVDQVDPVPHAINRYREPLIAVQAAIGCERCHGPGELHVAERSSGHTFGKIDDSIVNPHHLSAPLRLAICQQCHLQGIASVERPGRSYFDFRPGMPMDLFFTEFVRQPEKADRRHSVGQFEQMIASKCYIGSGDKLECTTCHDPHFKAKPEETAAFYRNKCLTCHEKKGCTIPEPERLAKQNNCISCHMTRGKSSNIPHTAVTDHTVARRPRPNPLDGPDFTAEPSSNAPEYPIVRFGIGPSPLTPADESRDFSLALARILYEPPPRLATNPTILRPKAEKLLNDQIAQSPHDAELFHRLAMLKYKFAGTKRTERQDALKAMTNALTLRPDDELFLAHMAGIAATASDFDTAIRVTTRMIELNPSAVQPRLARAVSLGQKHDWKAAEADCRAAIALQPTDMNAWDLLATCRQMQADLVGMQAALDTANLIKAGLK